MNTPAERNTVHIEESGHGPFGQFVSIGQHILGADEPGPMGGENTGPDPFELVMAGLGACTAMTVRMYANRKTWPLEEVRVAVNHVRATGKDGEKPHAFERLVTLQGPLDDTQRERLIAIADRCPVHRLLEAGAEIVTRAVPA
ncbi:OsmC family protein [Pseudogemmobacter sonorensis]|uniref:OsmC family protein n=1 Tax=Pseudogemmobacter sonorensis TaxID=2989681 RepID=UPI0036952CD7